MPANKPKVRSWPVARVHSSWGSEDILLSALLGRFGLTVSSAPTISRALFVVHSPAPMAAVGRTAEPLGAKAVPLTCFRDVFLPAPFPRGPYRRRAAAHCQLLSIRSLDWGRVDRLFSYRRSDGASRGVDQRCHASLGLFNIVQQMADVDCPGAVSGRCAEPTI